MNGKLKIVLGFVIVGIVSIVGFIVFGLYIMDEEDRYGDLVYFNQKVKDGDIIFRSNRSDQSEQVLDFNEFGIIEKSWGNVYVWDNQNSMKIDLYDWAKKGNGERVKVFRVTNTDFDINQAELENGTYNYLMNSNKLEFVTENY